MFRKILSTFTTLFLVAYLLLAITAFNKKPDGLKCQDLELVIRDSVYAGFIDREEVIDILDNKGLNPIGKLLDEVCTGALEKELDTHPLIDAVECYKTPSGKVCVEATQRIPVLRVMSAHGENYYVDNKGIIMPRDSRCVAHLVIATGNVDKEMATDDLYHFGMYLQNDAFWNAQIEQIHVLPDKTIELVPRVGEHIIYLGKLEDYKRKLKKVKLFYEKVLSQVGWDRYSRISVAYDNQVICKKR